MPFLSLPLGNVCDFGQNFVSTKKHTRTSKSSNNHEHVEQQPHTHTAVGSTNWWQGARELQKAQHTTCNVKALLLRGMPCVFGAFKSGIYVSQLRFYFTYEVHDVGFHFASFTTTAKRVIKKCFLACFLYNFM